MNCDEVFVILTRGPFPSGARTDAAVEAHLQLCPDCQRLAAALRPNERGLVDAGESDEARLLPGYWGRSLEPSGELAVSLSGAVGALRPKQSHMRRQQLQHGRNLNVWQFAAAVALGIVLAAALRTLVTVHSPVLTVNDPGINSIIAAPSNSRKAQWEDARWATLMCTRSKEDAKPIPSHLLDDTPPTLTTPEIARSDAERCCNKCHHNGELSERISATGLVQVAISCTACHHSGADLR